jgi:hypothetical protein
MRYCHEAQKHESPEDRVVLRWSVHNFEFQLFSPIILAIAKSNVECDST